MWLTPERKIGLRQSLIWLGVLGLTIAFREIYLYNSHGVYSDFIGFVWVPALVLLVSYVVVCFLFAIDVGEWGRLGFNCGIGTIIVYMVIKGIYEIARVEPENSIDVRWSPFFLVMGIACLIIGVVLSAFYVGRAMNRKKDEQEKKTL
jgi:hypothetical protein